MNLKKILLLTIPIFILLGFGVIKTEKAFSQPVCEVVNLKFNPNGDQTNINFLPANIEIIVETNGACTSSTPVEVQVHETASGMYFSTTLTGFSDVNKFAQIITKAGEVKSTNNQGCFGVSTCDMWLKSFVSGVEFNTKNQNSNGTGRITYNKLGVSQAEKWSVEPINITYSEDGKNTTLTPIGVCFAKINAIYLNDQDTGENAKFNESGNPTLTVEGETDGCSPSNGTMKIGIIEGNTDPYASIFLKSTGGPLLSYIIDEGGYFQKYDDINNTMMTIRNTAGGFMRFKISWKIGEKDCDGIRGISPTRPFCGLRAVVYLDDNDKLLSTEDFSYDIKDSADAKFSIISSEVFDKEGSPISVLGAGFKNNSAGLKASPCYVADPNGDGKTDDAGLKEGCLGLLAPLPDFDRFETGANPFTSWINTLLRVVIGIATLLAVIMLVIMGAQYMSSSLVTSKADAKGRIADIFIGLGLLFGIFIILNLINPSLLNLDPNVPVVDLISGGDGFGTELKIGAPPAGKSLTPAQEIAYIKQNGKPVVLTKKNGTTISIPPCDDANMTTVTVFNSSFKVHNSVASSINRINQKWAAQNPKYVIPASEESKKAMGGYVCRLTNDKKKVSNHAYGLAVDINPKENPHKVGLTTDMPQSFIQLWKDEGWGWGGDWTSSRKDPMHFSKLSNEGGDQKID